MTKRKYYQFKEIFTVTRGILEFAPKTKNFIENEGFTSKNFNIMCLTTFGSFALAPMVDIFIFDNMINDSDLHDLGEIIDDRFYLSWTSVKNLLEKEYDCVNPYFVKEIEDFQGTNISNDTTNTQESRDLYAFNSIDSVKDTKNDSSITGNRNNQNNSRRIKTLTGNNANIAPQHAIINEIEFRRKALIDYILLDLKRFATLPIYF